MHLNVVTWTICFGFITVLKHGNEYKQSNNCRLKKVKIDAFNLLCDQLNMIRSSEHTYNLCYSERSDNNIVPVKQLKLAGGLFTVRQVTYMT
jgi:hypothetical protein